MAGTVGGFGRGERGGSGAVSGLGSAAVPGVGGDDWIEGPADATAVLIEFADFECPFCAVLAERWVALARERGAIRHVFRHFPIKSAHPRAWAAACAAESAGRQGRFWEIHDLLFADQGRLDDPHLWERAERLGLDLDRFDADRRSAEVAVRIKHDFNSGVRAGVVTTPTVFVAGRLLYGDELQKYLETFEAG